MKKIFFALFMQAVLALPLMAQEVAGADTLGVVSSSSSAVGEAVSKAVADEAYAAGDYARAISIYEQLLATEGEAAEVYYNLGNSYFKQDQLAHAILNYERALLLQPGDDDIRFNLELAQSRTVDKITPLSELFFVRWAKDFASLQSSDGWTRLGIAAFLLVLAGVAVYLFASRMALRKVGFFVALACVVLCVVANLSAVWQKSQRQDCRWAIVMSPSVTAKSTPAHSGTDLFVAHEGLKVEIKDNTMTQWKEIRLPDGNVGWVPAEAVALIAE
ncbi:MAG: tetratricopeptide repeat protein [Bacteroidaceae bacterium]|nr:tetratricopeptide repeat protein [Bacteroidaceae bacterium]MBQ8191792.1 tetratricopeptide repeat protein [Bacteroidaceae bacterium]MBR6589663.1 tetratricopeptide repeat protein [Bacteroidaceae bacterium]